ncbi:MAG: aryl-sulfate sulfotransferase [Thermomicrobiales bacterium]
MELNKAPVRVNVCNPQLREPGTIYVTTRPGGLPTRSQFSWIVAFYQDGSVALNRQYEGTSQDIRHVGGHRLLFSQSAQGILNELDTDGNTLRRWHARGKFKDKSPPRGSVELPVDFMHHTVNVLPDGNLLILDAESRVMSDWPANADDPNAARIGAEIVGDVIVEVTTSGQVVKRYHLLDMLDPYRITHGSHAGYWRKQGFANAFDWSHCNAVAYDAHDDTLIASVRHQDCIVKFRRDTGELVWILGNHKHWKDPWRQYLLSPSTDLQWQFHQHDCSAPTPGRILCFDNGNFRAPAFEARRPPGANFSRLVEFEVDPENMGVSQVWSFEDPPGDRIYACYQGGALRLPKTGNTFGTFGGICTADGQPSDTNVGTDGHARLIEVTPGGEVVFDASIASNENAEKLAISAFRATHVPV